MLEGLKNLGLYSSRDPKHRQKLVYYGFVEGKSNIQFVISDVVLPRKSNVGVKNARFPF